MPLDRASMREKSRNHSCKRLLDSIFGSVATQECDSKANGPDKSEVSPQLSEYFPSTNQRADSFSHPGVNLEAKV
jgi:hypothetical protein